MKIRTDFVTNSSSSSFVTIKFTNKDVLKLLKESGLEGFSVYEDDEFNYRGTPELEEFFDNYLKSIDVVSCLTRYIRDKHRIDITRNDFIQLSGTNGYGEANHGYPQEYGVFFDGFIEETVVLDEEFKIDEELEELEGKDYKYDKDERYDEDSWVYLISNHNKFGESTIEFLSDGELIAGALKDSRIMRSRIDNFISRYGNKCTGYLQLVKAYTCGLQSQGKSEEEIAEVLKS